MRPLHEIGQDEIGEAWNASVVTKYRVDGCLIRQNLLAHRLSYAKASFWHDGSFVAIKRSAAALYPGPDPTSAHLSLFGGPETTPLLQASTDVLRNDGIRALLVGMDSGHFLPGAPVEPPTVETWLVENGFTPGGESVDLERDMLEYDFAEPSLPGVRRVLAESDVPKLESFLRREFLGRWHYDVMLKVEAEGPATVFVLLIDGACEGFALLQGEGCRLPIGGAVWKADLGPQWGSLGPIGVSRGLRGQGHGYALLGSALMELKRRGAKRSIIDWTGLVSFYAAHGFVVKRRYRFYRLEL